MKPEIIVVLGIFIAFILAEIIFTNFFKKKNQKASDGIVEFFSTGVLLLLTQPLIIAAVYALGLTVFPQFQDNLSGLHIVLGFGLFLIFDDLTQYWWHRMSHTLPWLYKLHRPHHNAEYMSIRLVYRNNIFYYMMMPGIWFSAILVYLGLGWIYAFYIVMKMTIIYGAHSDLSWDKPLYKIGWLSPIMWVVERTISTPATHHAHHGRHKADGITHYKGNFGNMLFLWDIIFGTAKITRQYPSKFGVENLPETSTLEQLIWPVVQKHPQPKDASTGLID
jgi:sterol desaturase/sphingolipid hydroxylase (fatty acid hydroxylase superfamily)